MLHLFNLANFSSKRYFLKLKYVIKCLFVMFYAIWYHLCNLKKREKHPCSNVTFRKVASACNFTKSNTPPWVFLTFFKLYKWYQIAQSTSFDSVQWNDSIVWEEIVLSSTNVDYGQPRSHFRVISFFNRNTNRGCLDIYVLTNDLRKHEEKILK